MYYKHLKLRSFALRKNLVTKGFILFGKNLFFAIHTSSDFLLAQYAFKRVSRRESYEKTDLWVQ